MEKKEQLFKFLNMLDNVLETFDNVDKIDKTHHFDINSEECKQCECFTICKEFHDMMTAINDSNFSEDVKNHMSAFIIFIKREYLFIDDFDIENILKSEHELLSGYYKRFESVVKEFKSYDKLVQILDNNQLSLIRKIVLDVVAKIEELMNKITDRNRAESVILISRLQKPQQEEKSYEDMSKEELIELLKHNK